MIQLFNVDVNWLQRSDVSTNRGNHLLLKILKSQISQIDNQRIWNALWLWFSGSTHKKGTLFYSLRSSILESRIVAYLAFFCLSFRSTFGEFQVDEEVVVLSTKRIEKNTRDNIRRNLVKILVYRKKIQMLIYLGKYLTLVVIDE